MTKMRCSLGLSIENKDIMSLLLLTFKNTLVMKNSILFIALGLILLTGCSKDESIEQLEEQTNNLVYVSKQYNGDSFWEAKKIDFKENRFAYPKTYGVTRGLYMPSSISKTSLLISWEGSSNVNGYLGSAEIKMTTPSYSFHFIMETECVTVIDNVAMYGGLITEVVEVTGDPPPFGIYWRFYFQVTDNDTGGHHDIDKISSMRIFASPKSMSLCNVYPPNHPIWSSQGYDDVHEPGFVDVDND